MVDGEIVIRQHDELMAYGHCIAAVKEASPKAQVLVRVALMNAVGVVKDPNAAASQLKRSADQKCYGGLYYLAMVKLAGLGSALDEKVGMVLMKQAAVTDEPRAMGQGLPSLRWRIATDSETDATKCQTIAL